MIRLLKNSLTAFFALLVPAIGQVQFDGESMGTTWHITVCDMPTDNAKQLIEAELRLVDSLMSTWRDDSEISRFNAFKDTEWFAVSAETAEVVQAALDVSAKSDGAFDITVSPLIDLWSFDRNTGRGQLPSDVAVASAMRIVGWQRVSVRSDPPAIRKTDASVSINLSAIAKGYAVDRITESLSAAGARSFLVEVGGEVRAAGLSPSGKAWRVGIEEPLDDARRVRTAVPLDNKAMATSGDYRNFYVVDGRRYSHTIDPRTGRPVEHSLASVTVVAGSCMLADAWATALTVLGPDDGAVVIEANNLAAVLTIRDGDKFTDTVFGAFPGSLKTTTPAAPEAAPMWPVFLAAALVFLLAIGGMAVGVIISNRRLKGSCGGLAGLTDATGQTACDLCAIPSSECRGEAAEAANAAAVATTPEDESQSPS